MGRVVGDGAGVLWEIFFFKQKAAYVMRISDWSSDVCSSDLLVELQRRLARLADLSGGGFSPEAMSPARIIRAFQDSVHDLQVDFPIKLVIYKLFDRVVVGRMSEVFSGANHLQIGRAHV